MSTKRITVSMPEQVANRIKHASGSGGSVSAWLQEAVRRRLDEDDVRRRFLDFCDAVKATSAEARRARRSFDQITRRSLEEPAKAVRRRGKTAA